MDMDQLVATWKLYLSRRGWERARADAEASGDAASAAAAEQALADLPAVGALDALRANAELVSMLSVQRWIAMKAAREQGATLEQIGKALGVSRQSAWEVFQRKIAEHQRYGSPQDIEADRAEADRGEEGSVE
jgi:hypothetical protein